MSTNTPGYPHEGEGVLLVTSAVEPRDAANMPRAQDSFRTSELGPRQGQAEKPAPRPFFSYSAYEQLL